MKRLKKTALLLALCLCLTGCVPLSVNLQRANQPVTLEAPEAEDIEPAVGDSVGRTVHSVTLYYASSDLQQLLPAQRTLVVREGESLPEKVLQSLMENPVSTDMRGVIPEGTQLLSMERAENVAVVNLSIDARNVEDEQQYFRMRAAIAATLTALEGIEYVNLLIGGREEGLLSLPAGAATRARYHESDTVASPEGAISLTSLWGQLTAEQELAEREGETIALERAAIIYYASRDGQYIAPSPRRVRVSREEALASVLEALRTPPEDGLDCLRSPMPQDTPVSGEIVETAEGERMARVRFDANLLATLEREGLPAWQLFASLTYTLTGFLPDLDGVVVVVGDGVLTRTLRGDEVTTFAEGEMSRSGYPDAVCSLAAVYLSASDGKLMRLYRPVDRQSALSPRIRLARLFDGPAPWEEGAARVFPDGVTIDDVLGIRVSGGEAVVNLSSNFYRCCQSLTPQQERALIYAMVNTLTELPNLAAVRFQVEGEEIDCLVSEMFLRGPLLRNPGAIR